MILTGTTGESLEVLLQSSAVQCEHRSTAPSHREHRHRHSSDRRRPGLASPFRSARCLCCSGTDEFHGRYVTAPWGPIIECSLADPSFRKSSVQRHHETDSFSYRSEGRFWPVDLCCAVVRRLSASLTLVSMRSDIIFLSNNSDVEVIGSLLLVQCTSSTCSLIISLPHLFLSADEISS
jgi:hypothetical protein